MEDSESIIKISSANPGPTVAIFAGIHGNEKAGVFAIKKVISNFTPLIGTVYFVFANPPAIEQNVRLIDKNLNRCFTANNQGNTWEDKRAKELMNILDQCDALLDLHGYNGPEDRPFAICEDLNLPILKTMNVETIVTNLSEISEGGTDGYMYTQNKFGICLECGSNQRPEDYIDFAIDNIYRFLSYFNITNPVIAASAHQQKVLRAIKVVKSQTGTNTFNRQYSNFDLLTPGEIFATDGDTSHTAEENNYIIFPRPNQTIGHEAFILAELQL